MITEHRNRRSAGNHRDAHEQIGRYLVPIVQAIAIVGATAPLCISIAEHFTGYVMPGLMDEGRTQDSATFHCPIEPKSSPGRNPLFWVDRIQAGYAKLPAARARELCRGSPIAGPRFVSIVPRTVCDLGSAMQCADPLPRGLELLRASSAAGSLRDSPYEPAGQSGRHKSPMNLRPWCSRPRSCRGRTCSTPSVSSSAP